MAFELTEAKEEQIIQAYPKPVAEAFKKTLVAQGVAAHAPLLQAAECALKYLALAAWSEYADHAVRSAQTDTWVGTVKKPGMGDWLRLFRESSSHNATSVLSVNVAQKHPSAEVEWQARFKTAWTLVTEGLGYGVLPSLLGVYVDRQLVGRQSGKLTVLEYLDAVIQCRNAFSHPTDGYQFGPEIADILNPLLRKSLGELLFMEPVKRLMVEYPWARPVEDAQLIYDPDTALFSMKFRLQRARDGFRQYVVTSSTPLTATEGYLVRASDKTPYVRFEWDWPDPSARPAAKVSRAPAQAVERDDRLTRGLARYETRYRDYLLDDGVLSDKELQALEDLADLGGLDADALAEIRERVDREDAVVARLAADAAVARDVVAPRVAEPQIAEAPPDAESQPARSERTRTGKWNRAEFYEDLEQKGIAAARADQVRRLHALVDRLVAEGLLRVEWGSGTTYGTFTAKAGASSLMTASSWGSISANVGAWEVLGPVDWMSQARCLADVLDSSTVSEGIADGETRWPDITDELTHADWAELERWFRTAAKAGELQKEAPWTLRLPEDHLGLPHGTLVREQLGFAQRALELDWSDLYGAIAWPHSSGTPVLRGKKRPGFSDGRLGVDLHDVWRPGIFLGVLVDPGDHRAPLSRPALGADFVVIVSVARGEGAEGIDGDTYIAQPEFEALRRRLVTDSGRWDLHDHLSAVAKPNRWHPIHLRRPLVDVLRGESGLDPTSTEATERRFEQWVAAGREAADLLLSGGELRALRDRLTGVEPLTVSSAGEPETMPKVAEGETGAELVSPASEPPPRGARPVAWLVREQRVDVRSWADIARWTAAYVAQEHPAAWDKAMDGPEFQGRLVRRVGRSPAGMLKPHPTGDGYIEINLSGPQSVDLAVSLLAMAGIDESDCYYVLPHQPAARQEAPPTDWPGSALALLTRLHADLDGNVPCVLTHMTDVDGLEVENNGSGLQLWIDEKRYIEVWFTSKYGATVWVVVSFASKNASRDPVFRATRAAIVEQEDLAQVPDWPFVEARDRLALEALKRLDVNELGSDEVVDTVAGLVRLLAGWVARHHAIAGAPA